LFLSAFLRWATFLPTIALIGLYGLTCYLPESLSSERERVIFCLRRWSVRFSWLLLLAAPGELVVRATNMAGNCKEALDSVAPLVTSTHYGHIWILRLGLIGVLLTFPISKQ